TENFVSPDYLSFGQIIGQGWLESGRDKIMYLGPDFRHTSISSQQRMIGLQMALGACGRFNELMVVSVESTNKEAGYQAIKKALNRGMAPDAILTFGDFIALGAIEALKEAGMHLPEQV